jgi:trans-aconitate methyltransferase
MGFNQGGDPYDLFRGTADYYAAYRRPYPPPVVDYVARVLGLDGRGRLLDGGCGPGQAFSVFAPYFEAMFAFDRDPEMVERARKTVHDARLAHVTVAQMRAEDLTTAVGPFRAAIFACSFHWMDRERVGETVYDLLEPRGGIAVIAPGMHGGALGAAIDETVREMLGPARRAGSGLYVEGERHEDALQRTRFGRPTTQKIVVNETWTEDQLIGWLYSTSFANKTLLGPRADTFETRMRERLRALEPRGVFSLDIQYEVIWALRAT